MAVDAEAKILVMEVVASTSKEMRQEVKEAIGDAEQRITKGMSLYLQPMNDKLGAIMAKQTELENRIAKQDERIEAQSDRISKLEISKTFVAGIISATGTVTAFLAWLIPQIVAYMTKGA